MVSMEYNVPFGSIRESPMRVRPTPLGPSPKTWVKEGWALGSSALSQPIHSSIHLSITSA